MRVWRWIVLSACLMTAGCFPHETESIGAIDPAASIPAIQEAARKRDQSAVPALIKQLSSDDPAVRFYAIEALKKITGQTMDYHYYDDADERKPAIERWEKWMTENKHGDTETRGRGD
jgi:HEAT repeat protein